MPTVLLNRTGVNKNESLYSFIHRLVTINYYEKVSLFERILDIRPGMQGRTNANVRYFDEQYEKLAELTLVPEDQLYRMTVHGFASKLSTPEKLSFDEKGRAFLKSNKMLKYISNSWTKFCPLCLKEGRYHRIHWDLLMVTSCLEHEVLLIDRCTKCGKHITVSEVCSGVHRCGAQLELELPTPIAGSPEILQIHYDIQKRLGLIDKNACEEINTIVKNLETPHYFNIISSFIQAMGKLPASSELLRAQELVFDSNKKSFFQKQLSNKNRHIMLSAVYKVLMDWPNNFYFFLDEYRKQPKVRNLSNGLTRDFLPLRNILTELDSPEFEFVNEAFKEYLLTRWDGGVIDKRVKYFRSEPEELRNKRYVNIEEAAQILNIGYKQVIALMDTGYLSFKTREANVHSRYLITRESINRVLDNLAGFLTIRQVAQRLDTDETTVSELIKSEFLETKAIFPKMVHQWVKESSISRFEECFLSGPNINSEHRRWCTLEECSRKFGFKTWAVPKVLNLVRHSILSIYIDEQGQGLNSLRFSEKELTEYYNLLRRQGVNRPDIFEPANHLAKGRETFISVSRVSVLMAASEIFVKRLGEKGLLPIIEKRARTGKLVPKIKLSDYLAFRKEHLFTEEVGELLAIDKHTVLSWQKVGRLKAIAGLAIDGGRRYLFKRSEINKFLPENRMTTTEAAGYLGVSLYYVLKKIQDKKLKPIGGPGADGLNDYLLARQDVEQFALERDNDLTLPQAAGLMGVSEYRVRDLIQKGKLLPKSGPNIDGSPVFIFQRADIEPYLKLLNSSEAASMLGVSVVALRKWTMDGRVRAVSGPKIDGEKYYKYKLLDLEVFKESLDSLWASRGSKAQYHLLSMKEVANILGILKQQVWDLLQGGRLKAYRGPNLDGHKEYLFRPDDINRFKKRFAGGNQLLSADEAASMLGEDLSWFYKKWVVTGRLKTVDFEDKLGKYFFKVADVKQLVKLKKDTITGPQAAQLIGVARSQILKWNKEEKLQPVSGPSIDGFGCYLYLRKDVLRLKRERDGKENKKAM